MIRNTSIKLAQPLQPKKTTEAAAVRFEQAYAAIQDLAYQLINNPLTRQRTRLVMRTLRHDLADLEQMARMVAISSPLQTESGKTADQYITEIIQRQDKDPIKKAYLATFIINTYGRGTLDDLAKEFLDQRQGTPA